MSPGQIVPHPTDKPDDGGAAQWDHRAGHTAPRIHRCLVDVEGSLEELEDKAAVNVARTLPEIVRYCRALLLTNRHHIEFIWVSAPILWLNVSVRRDAGSAGSSKAVLEMQEIAPPYDLSLRELDVVTMVAAGFGNETIAARLEISVRTVTKHVENIFRKVGVWTRAGIAGLATDQGLVRLPTPGGCRNYPLAVGQVEELATRLDEHRPADSRRARTLVRRPVLIGLPVPMAGRGESDAAEMVNGAELAVSEINSRGGVIGREIQLATAPFELGNPQSMLTAYERLLDQEVDAITAGYSCYQPSAHDLVGDYGAPLLHAATMQSVVERVRDSFSRLGNIFQTCASDVNYGLGLSRFLLELEQRREWLPRNRRLVVLQPFWPGLNVGVDQIDQTLGNQGWQIEVLPIENAATCRWSEVVSRLHRMDPTVVVLASYFVEDAIAFQRAFLENPLASLIYNLYSPSVPQFRMELGPLANGVVWATTTGLYADAIGKGFQRRYYRRFGVLPGQSQASIAYDRVYLLAGAWTRTGSSRRFLDVVKDLRSTIHRGVNGAYYLGNESQVGLAFPDDTADPSISQAHLVFQIQQGEQAILAPSLYATGKFVPPFWMRR